VGRHGPSTAQQGSRQRLVLLLAVVGHRRPLRYLLGERLRGPDDQRGPGPRRPGVAFRPHL
jgi:hypothetical protein